MKSIFYTKDGIEYLSKGDSYYGGELHLENDIKLDNLDKILDMIDDYVDVLEVTNDMEGEKFRYSI